MSALRDAFLVLGVTGSVAAYKAAELLRLLTEAGAQVQVAMTEHAVEFVRPLTFQILSGREVIARMFPIEGGAHPGDMPHISLTRRADLVVVAPATANLIGKFAHGIADDFLTTLLLSAPPPVVVAPAMNPRMYGNPLVQANLSRLRELGHRIVGPEEGPMACREEEEGAGRLAAPASIVEAIEEALRERAGEKSGDLSGLRLLVTAGPTREPWDPIRFLSNRSSGKMGYALAARAAARGARVKLVSGPTSLPLPAGVNCIRVETAEEMRKEVLRSFEEADAVIMAAAVSDFRPTRVERQKVKKGEEETLSLLLERTPDILAELGRRKGERILVGFAAETEDLMARAREKLRAKKLDLIVANPVGGVASAMGAEESEAHLLSPDGETLNFPPLPKGELADRILDKLRDLWRARKAEAARGGTRK